MVGGRVPGTPSGAIPGNRRIEADGRGTAIKGRLYLVLLRPVGHTHADREAIREPVGGMHGVDLDMLFKSHDTTPKRRAPLGETKRGLDEPQIRKHEAIQLAIEIGGEVFGPSSPA